LQKLCEKEFSLHQSFRNFLDMDQSIQQLKDVITFLVKKKLSSKNYEFGRRHSAVEDESRSKEQAMFSLRVSADQAGSNGLQKI
jgi:hypothetical protein